MPIAILLLGTVIDKRVYNICVQTEYFTIKRGGRRKNTEYWFVKKYLSVHPQGSGEKSQKIVLFTMNISHSPVAYRAVIQLVMYGPSILFVRNN